MHFAGCYLAGNKSVVALLYITMPLVLTFRPLIRFFKLPLLTFSAQIFGYFHPPRISQVQKNETGDGFILTNILCLKEVLKIGLQMKQLKDCSGHIQISW